MGTRGKIKTRTQKFDKSVDQGPQEYEYMGKLQADLIQNDRIKKQMKAQAKQKPKTTEQYAP